MALVGGKIQIRTIYHLQECSRKKGKKKALPGVQAVRAFVKLSLIYIYKSYFIICLSILN